MRIAEKLDTADFFSSPLYQKSTVDCTIAPLAMLNKTFSLFFKHCVCSNAGFFILCILLLRKVLGTFPWD